MISHFIENTNDRYSINENGEIHSHYRFLNNGKRTERLYKCVVYACQRGVRASIIYNNEKRTKSVFISTLMIKYFNLTPPDNFHLYELSHKDGNKLNFSLSNIEYKIRLTNEHNFYPQPFYKNGKIVSKICGQCGEKIDIKHFTLQSLDIKSKKRTYRNTCNFCRNKNNWHLKKTNKSSYEKHLLALNKWRNSESGKQYMKKYSIYYAKHSKETMNDHYICTILKIRKEDLTDKLRELQKKKLALRRQIFNN